MLNSHLSRVWWCFFCEDLASGRTKKSSKGTTPSRRRAVHCMYIILRIRWLHLTWKIETRVLRSVFVTNISKKVIKQDVNWMALTTWKQGSCLEKEIMQGTMPGAHRRGRPRTAWMDNINTWTGLSVEESIRMTEDRDKWRKYVHGLTNPRIKDE